MAMILNCASLTAKGSKARRETAAMEPIRGASLFHTRTHIDLRGELTALEKGSNLDFALQRVFFIRVEHTDTIRAEHACSAEQVVIVITGAVTVDIENGHQHSTVRLVQGRSGLWLRAGIWLRLREFFRGAVLSVAASASYADTVYFDRPQPDLISGD